MYAPIKIGAGAFFALSGILLLSRFQENLYFGLAGAIFIAIGLGIISWAIK